MEQNLTNNVLLESVDKVHTTPLGVERIKKNLKTGIDDVVEYCKNIIADPDCNIYQKGKNWYCELGNIRLTVNAYSYTIITAHLIK